MSLSAYPISANILWHVQLFLCANTIPLFYLYECKQSSFDPKCEANRERVRVEGGGGEDGVREGSLLYTLSILRSI